MRRFAQPARTRPHSFVALAALGALTTMAWLAAPAVASAGQPAADGLQTNVYYEPRDLATEHGRRVLYRHIVEAARAVCPGYDSIDPDLVRKSKACQRGAVARAIAQIGNPRLAALNEHAVAMAASAG